MLESRTFSPRFAVDFAESRFPAGDKEYIALLPLGGDEEAEGEVYLYRYTVTDDGPMLENIEDDDEYEAAADAFDEWLDEQEFEDIVEE